MKRILIPILALISSAAGAKLEWVTTVREFEVSVGDKKVVAEYPFTNSGPETVKIESVKTSCGCTTTKLGKDVYEPGEGGSITATFNIGQRVGKQSKHITVRTDDPVQPITQLKIVADIEQVVKILPRMVYWTVGTEPEPRKVELVALKEHKLDVTKIDWTRKSAFTATLTAVEPHKKYEIEVVPLTTSNRSYSTVYVHTTINSNLTRRFDIYARVVPERKKKEKPPAKP
jgi:hypothetical protein